MDNKLDALNEFLEESGERRPTTIELATSLTEGRENMVITLKKDVEVPLRMESPARNHIFWDIDGFAQFLGLYGTEDTVVLGDPATGTIKAVLNDVAEKGFETITFEARLHPWWQDWQNMLGKPMLVKDFAKFLITQKPLIIEPKADAVIQLFSQVRMSKKVELQTGFGDGSVNGVMVDVEIRGQQPDKQVVKLPAALTILCPMFIGRAAVPIRVDMVLDAKGDAVAVELCSGDAQARKLSEIDDMLQQIKNAMPERLVSLGSIGYQNWTYVDGE